MLRSAHYRMSCLRSRHRLRLLLVVVLAAALLSCLHASVASAKEAEPVSTSAQYKPQFWVFTNVPSESLQLVKDLGFVGVGFWAASRNREIPNRATYFFDSPALEKTGWADRSRAEGDLREYAARAHAAGLKVMANMESLNTWGWKAGRTQWTPELISAVETDLHENGADRWFTENLVSTPDLVKALAKTARTIGMEYQEGDDPISLHTPTRDVCLCHDKENGGASSLHPAESEIGSRYTDLFHLPSLVAQYHYHYARDEKGKSASLAEEGTLGFGFARDWGSPTALVYTIGHNWGESPENWEGILKASILIRALQFRTRDIMLIDYNEEKARRLDIAGTTRWVQDLVAKNAAEKRPVLNLVTHLRGLPGSHWRNVAASVDAIAGGAFTAGYDFVASLAPRPEADAYYVYTAGTDNLGTLDLTPEIVQLFHSGKPVFLQVGGRIPAGEELTPRWREALSACGLDPAAAYTEGDLPATGTYRGAQFKYIGVYTAYELTPAPHGTIIPEAAVRGEVRAEGDGLPLIVGKGRNSLLPASCLSWQTMYPISDLLAGCGVRSTSDVWGIAGAKVTALLATHDTTLDLVIPKLPTGAKVRVTQWDRFHTKTRDETVTYHGAYQAPMKQFDLIVIEAL